MSKAAYAIGDLARHTGTKVETIRWYERDGVMPAPVRTRGGHRLYTAAHRNRLAFIRHARELGFPLEDVRALLRLATSLIVPAMRRTGSRGRTWPRFKAALPAYRHWRQSCRA
jgi:hypothetical protein